MRVLYISHVGNLAGAARSLLELILSFPKNKIHPHIISPEGIFADEIRAKRIPIINTVGISQFDNTQYSFYRKLRWIIILREFFLFFCTLKTLIKAKKIWGNSASADEHTLGYELTRDADGNYIARTKLSSKA